MTTSAAVAPTRARLPGQRHDADIVARLGKAKGQLAGITSMYEDGRYCIEILDQLSAARAAIDAVRLILLQDHINSCVGDAVDSADSDRRGPSSSAPSVATFAAGEVTDMSPVATQAPGRTAGQSECGRKERPGGDRAASGTP